MSKQGAVERLNMLMCLLGFTPKDMAKLNGKRWKSWEEQHLDRFEYAIEERIRRLEGFTLPEVERLAESLRSQMDQARSDFGSPQRWLLAQYNRNGNKVLVMKAWKIRELYGLQDEFSWRQVLRAARELGIKRETQYARGKQITVWRLP